MAYIYNDSGLVLGTINDVNSIQLAFYPTTTTDLIPVTLGFEKVSPPQLVTTICPRTTYVLRLSASSTNSLYLGNNFNIVTDRRLASPFTILTTINGRVVTGSPFRARLSGQLGIYTLIADTINYTCVGYTSPLSSGLSSCQSCGCPPDFTCGTDGACYYNPNPCNGLCRGTCYGLCPSGSFCNRASNGLYGCISDVGNSWFWFWLLFLLFIVFLIVIIMVISAASSKNKKTNDLINMVTGADTCTPNAQVNSQVNSQVNAQTCNTCVLPTPQPKTASITESYTVVESQ